MVTYTTRRDSIRTPDTARIQAADLVGDVPKPLHREERASATTAEPVTSSWGFNSVAQAVRFTRRRLPGTSRDAVGVQVGVEVIHML